MGGPVFNRPVEGTDDDIKLFGVLGRSNRGFGVFGDSHDGGGVLGMSSKSFGVYGQSNEFAGVMGGSLIGNGVSGYSLIGNGVSGYSYRHFGVLGFTETGYGVYGKSNTGSGVVGRSDSLIGIGVQGVSEDGHGVGGYSTSSTGVSGYSFRGYGVYGGTGIGYAAFLNGRVYIRGPLEKPGGQFKIDHPLDPANKYLHHSFVESPDMKNVYDGVVRLDDNGEAEVELPDWFSALNKDYRYQLTAIGAPGPNLYVAKEISESITDDIDTAGNTNNNDSHNHSSFKVAGGTSGMKVSWQVTGIRKDPWANAHRVQVEEDKPDKERGRYIYPDLYGQSADKGINRLFIPQEMKVPVVTKDR